MVAYRFTLLSLFYFMILFVFVPNILFGINDVFNLEKISYTSDIPFEKSEFLYLTNLKEGTFVSQADLDLAKANLYKKGRFTNIEIKETGTKLGKSVNFILTSGWVLKKVKLTGLWFGKHDYLSLYKQNAGNIFDIDVHEHSLQEITRALHAKGYYNCIVSDELIYNKKDKSIFVKININKKKRFSIKEVIFNIVNKNNIKPLEESFSSKKLRSKVYHKLRKRKYSKALISKALKKIKINLNKKNFINNKVLCKKRLFKKDKKLDLIFNIYLGRKQEFKFIGNKVFSSKEIKNNFLGKEYPAWFFTPDIMAQEIFEEYYKNGYWNTKIYYKKVGQDNYIFNIKENSPVLVDEIIINDENNKNREDLLGYFKPIFDNKYFNEEILDESINKLTTFHLEQGFWNFNLVEKKFVKKNNGRSCQIIILINRGKQRFWAGLKIEGFNKLEQKEFFAPYVGVNRFKNFLEPFNFYILQKQKLFLLKYFQKKGYWYVDVVPELKEIYSDEFKVKILVLWSIRLGPKVKFGKVFFKGSTSLSFRRLLKELNFKENENWNKNKIDLTIKNFKKLEIFKKVWIEPEQEALAKKVGNIPVKFSLVDDDPVQGTVRLGYFLTNKNFLFKRSSTFNAGGSLIFKNPTNQLDKLVFNIDFTRFERNLDLDYKILSPFGLKFNKSRLIGKLKAYSNKYIHPVQIKQGSSAYEAVENGFLVGLNNEYKKDYFWRLNVGNEWIRTSKIRGKLNFNENYINKTLPYFFISPSFVIEKIDDKLEIKKGSISFFSLKLMIPEYLTKPTNKLMLEQSVFKPISKNSLIAARFRLGYILNSKFDQVQPSQRFYLGGPYSVRGYEKNAIPPYGIEETDQNNEYTIQGGSGMINVNLEYRFPLYRSLRGVIFQDIGALSQSGFAGFKGKWFPSTGFGFRYKTPIGPIRFDIGFKWKHLLPGDTFYSWYLTLGEVF